MFNLPLSFQEFKRSRNLERRLEDPDKSVNAPVEYTPFSAASEKEEELKSSNSPSSFADMKRKMGTYDNFFVKSGDRRGKPRRNLMRCLLFYSEPVFFRSAVRLPVDSKKITPTRVSDLFLPPPIPVDDSLILLQDREATAEEDEADLKRRIEARDRERESERERRKVSSASASSGGEEPQPPPAKKGAIHRDDLEGRGEERKRKLKGNTVFVKGHGLNEDIVRTAFERFGKLLNVKMDSDNRNNWFLTYLEQNDAATAIRQMDNTMVSEIHLHVAMARHQVDISSFMKDVNVTTPVAGNSDNKDSANKKTQDWTSMATSTNHKSEHEDKRALITYDIDDEFE